MVRNAKFCIGPTASYDQLKALYEMMPLYETAVTHVGAIPHICPFFSTDKIFGPIFLHAKARKSRQNRFRDKMA